MREGVGGRGGAEDRVEGEGDQVQGGVGGEEQGDDDGLANFDAVDAGVDVDAVGGEDGESGHVEVVEGAEVDEARVGVGYGCVGDVGEEEARDDDGGYAEVNVVDEQEGEGG